MSHHEKLKWMKDCLICAAENQMCDLEEVDTKELGEVIDMIKDLEEAIYYSTVTEAMKADSWEMKKGDHHLEESDGRLGRSMHSRKMYMESREMNKDRSVQLRELERYTQDLSQDVMEMISEASPEEKQYLEKKVTAMAAKISQLK